MKDITTKSYIVSSADWEIEVDEENGEEASASALTYALLNYGNRLSMSTVMMAIPKKDHIRNRVSSAEFFASSEIFGKLGMTETANHFIEFKNHLNESQSIK